LLTEGDMEVEAGQANKAFGVWDEVRGTSKGKRKTPPIFADRPRFARASLSVNPRYKHANPYDPPCKPMCRANAAA
jgi:hypothetical protein